MFYYLNLFLISSMFGYLLETTLKTFFFHAMNNGILNGPWIPIYGFGVVIITLISKGIFRNLKVSKLVKTMLTFLSVSIILTILEWVGGTLIELITKDVFWDYRKLKFNFGKYVALEMSLLWGVASIIFIYVIKPFEDRLIKKIPKTITIIVFGIFLTDFTFTLLSI